MRRLPVFFTLDCSESMVGENIDEMQRGMEFVIKNLRSDPYALETVFVSVIGFAGIVRTLLPLVEVFAYYPITLPIGGGTNFGKALEHLMFEIDRYVVKSTTDHKGDWKPIVYIFTDGRPTDDYRAALQKWEAMYKNKVTLVAIAIGEGVDLSVLQQITEHVVVASNMTETEFKKIFKWISASVVAQSQSLGTEMSALLPKLDEGFSFLDKEYNKPVVKVDDFNLTLIGRCSKKQSPYLIKYEKNMLYNLDDVGLSFANYQLKGCYIVAEDYFTWSDNTINDHQFNSNLLQGAPMCPHCHADSAFALCGCGKLMCFDGFSQYVICPWCQRMVSFTDGDSEGFDVTRGKG
nr:TerY-C metal binding domain-containing protein [Moraxella osloensis]